MTRFKKALGVLVGSALLVGMTGVGVSSAATGTKLKGSGAGSITATGTFSDGVEMSGHHVTGAVDLEGSFAEGSGIGKRSATVQTTSDAASGSFSSDFSDVKGRMTGTLQGSLSGDGGTPFPPSNLSISINCVVSYPPLSIVCTITIKVSSLS